MTAAQLRTVEFLRAEVLKHHGHGDNYEYKSFEVNDSGALVFVQTEVGLKSDEQMMASVLCRTRRLIAIGKRGGMKLLNARKKNVIGSACLWELTR